MIIRDATQKDFSAIREIYAHHVLHGTGTFEEEPPSHEEMLRRFEAVRNNGLPWTVADVDGEIAGYAYAQRYHARSGWRITLEDSIYITQERMGHSIGRALLADLIQRCAALGYREMLAVIGDSRNTGSITLHERAGFTHAGLLKNVGIKFGRYLDVVLMQRTLNE